MKKLQKKCWNLKYWNLKKINIKNKILLLVIDIMKKIIAIHISINNKNKFTFVQYDQHGEVFEYENKNQLDKFEDYKKKKVFYWKCNLNTSIVIKLGSNKNEERSYPEGIVLATIYIFKNKSFWIIYQSNIGKLFAYGYSASFKKAKEWIYGDDGTIIVGIEHLTIKNNCMEIIKK